MGRADTVLAAMKRSARAVLAPELKAARAAKRELRRRAGDTYLAMTALQREVAQSKRDAAAYRAELVALRDRARRAVDWAESNALPHGNRVALVLAQWVVAQEEDPRSFGIVCPFDRWNITPKP